MYRICFTLRFSMSMEHHTVKMEKQTVIFQQIHHQKQTKTTATGHNDEIGDGFTFSTVLSIYFFITTVAYLIQGSLLF